MNSAVIAALISGAATILVTVITVISTNAKTRSDITTKLAVQETKLSALTEEVRSHNNFASRIPVLEAQMEALAGRVENLERGR
ncbi:MAG: hypothetical protein IK082_05020 [Oscillospiraceae bacterium]|nr:hypothetical protein [Oscillospiraceae bacterium]